MGKYVWKVAVASSNVLDMYNLEFRTPHMKSAVILSYLHMTPLNGRLTLKSTAQSTTKRQQLWVICVQWLR